MKEKIKDLIEDKYKHRSIILIAVYNNLLNDDVILNSIVGAKTFHDLLSINKNNEEFYCCLVKEYMNYLADDENWTDDLTENDIEKDLIDISKHSFESIKPYLFSEYYSCYFDFQKLYRVLKKNKKIKNTDDLFDLIYFDPELFYEEELEILKRTFEYLVLEYNKKKNEYGLEAGSHIDIFINCRDRGDDFEFFLEGCTSHDCGLLDIVCSVLISTIKTHYEKEEYEKFNSYIGMAFFEDLRLLNYSWSIFDKYIEQTNILLTMEANTELLNNYNKRWYKTSESTIKYISKHKNYIDFKLILPSLLKNIERESKSSLEVKSNLEKMLNTIMPVAEEQFTLDDILKCEDLKEEDKQLLYRFMEERHLKRQIKNF